MMTDRLFTASALRANRSEDPAVHVGVGAEVGVIGDGDGDDTLDVDVGGSRQRGAADLQPCPRPWRLIARSGCPDAVREHRRLMLRDRSSTLTSSLTHDIEVDGDVDVDPIVDLDLDLHDHVHADAHTCMNDLRGRA